jgi:hypothetical protein
VYSFQAWKKCNWHLKVAYIHKTCFNFTKIPSHSCLILISIWSRDLAVVFLSFLQIRNETTSLDFDSYCCLVFIRMYFRPDKCLWVHWLFFLEKIKVWKSLSGNLNKFISPGEKSIFFSYLFHVWPFFWSV